MTIDEALESVRKDLTNSGSPQGIQSAIRFFKEPVNPYGVGAPRTKEIARVLYHEVKQWAPAMRNKLCTKLMQSGKMEEGHVATYVYGRFAKQCELCEFQLFERWIDRYVHNWAHTDGICTVLVAASIQNKPELVSEFIGWTKSDNRWKRRAAAVSLVKAARAGNHTDTIFNVASLLMEDSDEMVQKGAGWLLKETYPKHPKETVEFLQTWKSRTSRLLLRYAAEKMTASDRKKVLGA